MSFTANEPTHNPDEGAELSYEEFLAFVTMEERDPAILEDRLWQVARMRLIEATREADLVFTRDDLKGALSDARGLTKQREAEAAAQLYERKAAGEAGLTDKAVETKARTAPNVIAARDAEVAAEMEIALHDHKINRCRARLASLDELKASIGHLSRAMLGERIHS